MALSKTSATAVIPAIGMVVGGGLGGATALAGSIFAGGQATAAAATVSAAGMAVGGGVGGAAALAVRKYRGLFGART